MSATVQISSWKATSREAASGTHWSACKDEE
jgi:hypothetical protein